MTKATIVPKKIANRCHACIDTPSGVGKSQTIMPKEIGKINAVIRRDLLTNNQVITKANITNQYCLPRSFLCFNNFLCLILKSFNKLIIFSFCLFYIFFHAE